MKALIISLFLMLASFSSQAYFSIFANVNDVEKSIQTDSDVIGYKYSNSNLIIKYNTGIVIGYRFDTEDSIVNSVFLFKIDQDFSSLFEYFDDTTSKIDTGVWIKIEDGVKYIIEFKFNKEEEVYYLIVYPKI